MANNIAGLDGMQGNEGKGGKGIRVPELILRLLAVILTLTAAILLGVNKQTKIVPLKISPDLPAFNVPVSAKTSYASAFVYSMVANSISCALATILLALSFTSNKKGGKGALRLIVIIVDLMVVVLLFSSVGAAGAVGLIGFNGNSHLRWNKVCNVYGKFCHQIMASLALSLLGAILFLLLVILAVLKLHRNAYN